MIYGAIWRDNEIVEWKRNGFYIYVSVPLISVAGKYGGDNPVEYLVRFRTFCDISVSFSCGVGGAVAAKVICYPERSDINAEVSVLNAFEKLN